MTSHEPVLHALSVEPSSARAGDTVRAVFRTRNLGALASPPGLVRFDFGEGLEPLGPPEVTLDPVEPGCDVLATVNARVSAPHADRVEILVRAELRFADRALASNVCAVTVRSRPVLDGPASGTFVEPVDGETVRVRAVVTNEGAGPAGALRILVPTPLGCARDPASAATVLDRQRLDAGESAELAFLATIAGPGAELCADEGEVQLCDEGRSVALPVRSTFVPVPALAAPEIVLSHARRRVEIAVSVRNDGWADARGVRVRIALPEGLHPVDESLTADGMPVTARAVRAAAAEPIARAERERDARTVVLAVVAARTTARVALAATYRPGGTGGTIRVTLNDDAVDVPFAPHRERVLRVRIIGSPRTVAPGEPLRIVARVENLGDAAEELRFAIDGVQDADRGEDARMLAAGTATVVSLPAVAPHEPGDVRGTFVVFDGDGERARAGFVVPVRSVRAAASEAPAGEAPPCEVADAPAERGAGAAFAVRLVLESIPPAATIDAATVDDADADDVAAAACAPLAFSLRLDAARLDEIARLRSGFASGGLAGHLFALRLFFPDAGTVRDPGISAALAVLSDRLRDVFDRLFVKLRIPGFVLCCDDLEDPPLRAAIVALLGRLDAGIDEGVPPAFAAAPLGAPEALRSLTALLPSRCDDDPRLADALGRHAALLDDALGRYAGAPLELFDEGLAHRSEPALDIARAEIVDLLRPHLATLESVC